MPIKITSFKCHLLIILLSVWFVCLKGQSHDQIWVFGDSTGIDFTILAAPTPFSTSVNGLIENSSSFSDSEGNLQLYINGVSFSHDWDVSEVRGSDDSLISNGDSILSNSSQTQGSIFLKHSNSPGKVILLQLVGFDPFTPDITGMHYTVINFQSVDNAYVVQKNVKLINHWISERLHASKHANGKDWWILAHSNNSNVLNNGI